MALDFVCIGAQRAGTTWLFSRLSMHPNVYFPHGKEINFWNREKEFAKSGPEMSQFYHARFRSYFTKEGETKQGDISPAYAPMGHGSIQALYKSFPKAAILYVLRNPILRNFSGTRFSLMHNLIEESNLEKKSLRSSLSKSLINPHNNYLENIKRWRTIAEKVKGSPPQILFYENLKNDPVGFLRDVSGRVGVDGTYYDKLPVAVIAERINSAPERALPIEVYAEAVGAYRPMVEALQDLLKRDLSGWLDPDAPTP